MGEMAEKSAFLRGKIAITHRPLKGLSFLGVSLGGVGVIAAGGNGLTGIAMIGAGIVCAGLSAFMFFGCKAATKGILKLTKKFAIWIKNCFIKKEEA